MQKEFELWSGDLDKRVFNFFVNKFNRDVNKKIDQNKRPLTQEEIEIGEKEKAAWEERLDGDIEVADLPEIVTTDVRDKFREDGITLKFIPELNVGSMHDLRNSGTRLFVESIIKRYKGLEQFNGVNEKKAVHKTTALLDERYWYFVKEGRIPFPIFSKKWIAVDDLENAALVGDKSILSRLGLSVGFDVSFVEARKAIAQEGKSILEHFGFSSRRAKVDILKAPDVILLRLREEGADTKTGVFELTKTKMTGKGSEYRASIGALRADMPQGVQFEKSLDKAKEVYVRPAIILESK